MTDIPHINIDNIVWHDDQGHVFKDKLIEAFNYIEEKINSLSTIAVGNFDIIDVSNHSYPDVTLQDLEDDSTKIINLKSYCDIMGLVNFPLVVETDGGFKVTKVKYINSDYETVTIEPDGGVTANEDTPFIHLDTDLVEIIASATFKSDKPLLAVYKNGELITNNTKLPANVNFMKVLSDQQRTYSEWTATSSNKNYKNTSGDVTMVAKADTKKRKGPLMGCTDFCINPGLREDTWGEYTGGEDDDDTPSGDSHTVTNLASNTSWGEIQANANNSTAYKMTTSEGHEYECNSLYIKNAEIGRQWIFPKTVYVTDIQYNFEHTGAVSGTSYTEGIKNLDGNEVTLPATVNGIYFWQKYSVMYGGQKVKLKNVSITYKEVE